MVKGNHRVGDGGCGITRDGRRFGSIIGGGSVDTRPWARRQEEAVARWSTMREARGSQYGLKT